MYDGEEEQYEKPKIKLEIASKYWTIAAYHLEHDHLLVATKGSTIVVDSENWTVLSNIKQQELIHEQFKGQVSYCCQPDYDLNFCEKGAGFLRTFENTAPYVPKDIQSNHAAIKHHEEDEDNFTWLARFSFDYEQGRMILKEATTESILFEGELCWSVYEYAPGRMLVSTKKNIFNLQDWQMLHVYENNLSLRANFDKMGYFLPMPGFDLETFPFMIVSGAKSIKILNVNTDYMEALVKTKATATYGQEAFFFRKREFGIELNFTTGRKLFNGNKRLEWVVMDLKPQFSKTLEKIGMLPCSSVEAVIQTMLENHEWKEEKRKAEELGEDPV